MIKSISSVLYNPTEALKIQLSVGLIDSKNGNPNVNLYERSNGIGYLTINPNISIVICYTTKDRKWDIKDNAYVTQRNIYTLRMGLKTFCGKYYRDSMYEYDPTTEYVSQLNATDDDFVIINLGKGQIIRLDPAIIYDEKNKPFPGIVMRINRESNTINLFVDEFEGLLDLFEHVNIRQEGIMLFQTYILLSEQDKRRVEENSGTMPNKAFTNDRKNVRSMNIFEEVTQKREDEKVIAPPPKPKEPESIFDL